MKLFTAMQLIVTFGAFALHLEDRYLGSSFLSGGAPSFIIRGTPSLGGVEYRTVIPSLTVATGIRLPEGVEFGLGPNVIFGGKKGVNTSLVVAVGKSFNYSGVSIPVNLAFATSPAGNRISVIFGYAIAE